MQNISPQDIHKGDKAEGEQERSGFKPATLIKLVVVKHKYERPKTIVRLD